MLSSTAAYKEAIVATSRRMHLLVTVDITDPDMRYTGVTTTSNESVSKVSQLYDKNLDNPDYYATLEHNRWILNGTAKLYPAPSNSNQGYISSAICDANGNFATPQTITITFTDCTISQGCTIQFPNNDYDGFATDFTLTVYQGGVAYFTKTVTNNREKKVVIDGYTIYNPDKITLTVRKMSIPYRRLRIVEFIPGFFEQWTEHNISSFSVQQQGDPSCLSLPYGSCDLTIDNLNRKFEVRNKAGIFQSIEERQRIETSLGVELPDGTTEYKPTGTFYQYSDGWKSSKNSMLISWKLVDIIGLIANREYNPPATLPTTLGAWVKSIVSQLGVNFTTRYKVDSNYSNLPVVAPSREDVTGKSCGDLLLYMCMLTGTWPRADSETGHLTVEPTWITGNKITLDNMSDYPEISANQDIAAIFFTLNDTKYVVSGTSTSSDVTSSVDNPFITDTDTALKVSKQILTAYGGNQYQLTSRGDPSCEIGDVNTIWIDRSSAASGRVTQQKFSMTSGVLKDCSMTLIQPDGSTLYENMEIITRSGTWTAPAGVTSLRVILIGGGDGGHTGEKGNFESRGANGEDGQGGLVWTNTIGINNAQVFSVTIGRGGAIGEKGTNTIFGAYSSANGTNFDPNYIDIATGNAYARDGVEDPMVNTGDGGKGGRGGAAGVIKTSANGNEHVVKWPKDGDPGIPGASGCVIIYWDK